MSREAKGVRRESLSQKILGFALSATLLALCLSAEAQPQKKVPPIGFLAANRTQRTEAFRQGLRELGYIEGKNIIVEYRFAEGALNRLPTLADELVRLHVEVIVTAGAAATRACQDSDCYNPHCYGKRQ